MPVAMCYYRRVFRLGWIGFWYASFGHCFRPDFVFSWSPRLRTAVLRAVGTCRTWVGFRLWPVARVEILGCAKVRETLIWGLHAWKATLGFHVKFSGSTVIVVLIPDKLNGLPRGWLRIITTNWWVKWVICLSRYTTYYSHCRTRTWMSYKN